MLLSDLLATLQLQATTRKTRILDVVYNSSNNELVRTQTLVKNAIIQIDATPFRQWYNQHYGVEVGLKKKLGAANVAGDEAQVLLTACSCLCSRDCLAGNSFAVQHHVVYNCI